MDKQKMIEDNMKLVYWVVHRYFPHISRDEDVIQTGMLGLVKAVNSFDEEKGVFSSWATNNIVNTIRNYLRDVSKHKDVLSLNKTYQSEDGEVEMLGLIPGDEDVGYSDFEAFCSTLTEEEKQLVDARLVGLTTAEQVEFIGYSAETLNKRLREIKRKWRKYNGAR